MNILYSKKNMINCSEGCSIGNYFKNGKGLILFNKNILKLYLIDKNNVPIFLYEKHLLENILQIETYLVSSNSDGIIILFESTKMCTLHFVDDIPVVNSLKFFEKNEYDIRHNDLKYLRFSKFTGILKISRRFFSIFSLNENGFPARAFCFTDIDERVKNVIDIVFMTNYVVPTFCIIFNSTPRSYINACENQAIICSYDDKLNTFYVIDEFNVPTYTTKAIFSKDVLILISNNELFFKTPGSSFYYPLNKMSLYCKDEHTKDIVIKDAQFYFEDEHLVIFNGDGKVYNIYIKFDSDRIIDIEFVAIETLTIPKFISRHENLLYLGSNEASFLFEVSFSTTDSHKDETGEAKKQRFNMEEIDLIINEEYEKMYGTTIGSSEKKNIHFNKIYEFPGIGYINDLCARSEKEYVACSEGVNNYILEFTNFLKLNIKKAFPCINYERVISYGKRIYVKKENQVCEIRDLEDLEKIPDNLDCALATYEFNDVNFIVSKNKIFSGLEVHEIFDYEISTVKFYRFETDLFLGMLDTKNTLHLKNITNSTEQVFEKVSMFCFFENYCVINVSKKLIFYNFSMKQNQWIINNITNLDYNYKLDLIDEAEDCKKYIKIVELEIIEIKNYFYLFLINENGFFALYRIVENDLVKILLEETIIFVKQKSSRYFTKVQDFIHINSKVPYFLYVNDRQEIFLYKSYLTIRDIYIDNENYLFLLHDKLVQATLPKIPSTKLTRKSDIFRNLNVLSTEIYDRYIFRKIFVNKIPKNVEISGNYILVVSCERVKFKENTSEDNVSDVFTYKYSIDLYTSTYKFMSTFELESDEFVFDIKELSLNDSIGINGKSNFIVVCVTKIEGEDKHSRGRLIILELIDIVTDETSKYKDKKLKLIASENIKGCIIKCDEVKGNVVVALGIKTMVYKIDRSDGLIPIGIHDLHTLTTSLVTIKNFVLSSDIYRGLSFFYFQKRPVRLNLICTTDPIQFATHVDYIVKGSSLGIICMDVEGNMHTYTYSPLNILSCDGTKFVKRCETRFNLGRLIMRKAHSKLAKPTFISDSNYFIEIDTLSEDTYSDFLKVQNSYLSMIDDTFGLSPYNFNSINHHLKPPSIKKPIVREIIMRFIHMPMDQRSELKNEELKIYENL